MELSGGGGDVAANRASSATGEDRLSALPDELLLIILLFLNNAADAARTSVLSRRWRLVSTQLPALRIPFFPEPLLRRYLKLEGDGATCDSLAIWLPDAARRLCGTLQVLVNHVPDPESAEEMPPKDDSFKMPCFDNAAEIFLDLGFLHVLMPLTGVFARLTILVLERVWFGGACRLGDAPSSPHWCCPCLQVLKILNASGLSELIIYSESLLELELSYLDSLLELTVEAAVLKKLTVVNCFWFCSIRLIGATISAPRLVFLQWRDSKSLCRAELGQMPHLQSIGELTYFVYGPNGIPSNSACMKLLQPFKAIESLALSLAIMRDLSTCQYLMEDMKVLPNPAIVYLDVLANGYSSFGASLFHVLRMCLGIKKLVLVLLDNVEAEAKTPCLPGCVCNEQPNWKNRGAFVDYPSGN